MRKITGHPNVMNLVDFKVDGKLNVPDVKEPQQVPYLVMELVQGGMLFDYIDK